MGRSTISGFPTTFDSGGPKYSSRISISISTCTETVRQQSRSVEARYVRLLNHIHRKSEADPQAATVSTVWHLLPAHDRTAS